MARQIRFVSGGRTKRCCCDTNGMLESKTPSPVRSQESRASCRGGARGAAGRAVAVALLEQIEDLLVLVDRFFHCSGVLWAAYRARWIRPERFS